MDSDKKDDDKDLSMEEPKTNEQPTVDAQEAPSDALSKTPDELEEERAAKAAADTDLSGLDEELPELKVSPLRRFLRKINVYFLIFIVLLVIAGIIVLVSWINSQKPPVQPGIESQTLTTEALKSLANTDASVGNTAQTLTIQGSAIINGQALARGNLNVAGNFQTGGSITAPALTVSGNVNLGDTQANTLQIAGNTAIQGSTSVRDLTVSGTSTFSGGMTASQITVTRLILSGNASLEVPNHISFTGSTPSRSVSMSILGNGGSANISGSDTSGTINVNSGNNPKAGCFITVTFNQAFPRQPRVIVSPSGPIAGKMQFYTERNTTSFKVCSANAPDNNRSFAFDYFVTY